MREKKERREEDSGKERGRVNEIDGVTLVSIQDVHLAGLDADSEGSPTHQEKTGGNTTAPNKCPLGICK